MQSIAKVERKKEVFRVTSEELCGDEWAKKIRDEIKKGNSVEFTYINSVLTLRTYFITEQEKGELEKE